MAAERRLGLAGQHGDPTLLSVAAWNMAQALLTRGHALDARAVAEDAWSLIDRDAARVGEDRNDFRLAALPTGRAAKRRPLDRVMMRRCLRRLLLDRPACSAPMTSSRAGSSSIPILSGTSSWGQPCRCRRW